MLLIGNRGVFGGILYALGEIPPLSPNFNGRVNFYYQDDAVSIKLMQFALLQAGI